MYPGISLAPSEELRRFVTGSAMAHICIIIGCLIDKDDDTRAIIVAFLCSYFLSGWILMMCRSAMRICMRKTHVGGIPAVIYSTGETGKKLIDRLQSHRWTGYMPVVILDNNEETSDFYNGIPIIHDMSAGGELIKRFNFKMAIYAIDNLSPRALTSLYNNSISAFRRSIFIPSTSTSANVLNIWMSVRDFDGILGFATTHRLKMRSNLAVKRAMDIGIVAIGLLIVWPIIALLAILVKVTSPGPVLYGHKRVGRNNEPFKMYKFRSMRMNADKELDQLFAEHPEYRAEWEETHKLKDDPRVTAIGKFLRATSLDEVPQVLNILRGDMSLVGPRPVTEEERHLYGDDFDRIFSVRPGVSGLWQVSGRSDTSYADRVAFDTYYLQSWSIWLDLWVLYKTMGVVIRRKGAY
jgi:Undecaprenyl-phosphate galactose phosphotransferase WbaP